MKLHVSTLTPTIHVYKVSERKSEDMKPMMHPIILYTILTSNKQKRVLLYKIEQTQF